MVLEIITIDDIQIKGKPSKLMGLNLLGLTEKYTEMTKCD